ncbi:MAG: UDP-2,4-diacetamido-2,4,6-trideoxy-beta-L-altropyranose hydrolase [Pseudohongiellaceae bacterium]|jgi:UDP-2,4-diacetamido-2,4,6-trideoxy-beta-L-altropyranose hydrolase
MQVVFRVDASTKIGSGHVMRCLALANYLSAIEIRCLFIGKKLTGSLLEYIKQKGHTVAALEVIEGKTYLGGSITDDAQQTIQVMQQSLIKADFLIVDHYSLDARWEGLLRPFVKKIFVIDDLANRAHDCDVLLDQGMAKIKSDYQKLVDSEAKILLGPSLALLRGEFSQWRKEAVLNHQQKSHVNRLLIALGGADTENYTELLINVIDQLTLGRTLDITVVIGAQYAHQKTLATIAKKSNHHITTKQQIDNMAEIMANVDFAIGAAGVSSWERCALALPSITLCTVDNQIENSQVLETNHAAFVLDAREADIQPLLVDVLQQVFSGTHQTMSSRAAELCDGLGCYRVAEALLNDGVESLDYSAAQESDCELVYQWQCHPDTRRYALNTNIPSWQEHSVWFERMLQDANRKTYIVKNRQESVGFFRLDFNDVNNALISIVIAPDYYGQGIASKVLSFARTWWHGVNIKADVLPENNASIRAFEKAGYLRTETGFLSQPQMI